MISIALHACTAHARTHTHTRTHSCHGYRPVTAHPPTARHNHALKVNAFNVGRWGVYRLPAAYSGLITDMVVTENSLIKRTQPNQSIYDIGHAAGGTRRNTTEYRFIDLVQGTVPFDQCVHPVTESSQGRPAGCFKSPSLGGTGVSVQMNIGANNDQVFEP